LSAVTKAAETAARTYAGTPTAYRKERNIIVMNKKEISEIRKLLNPVHQTISRIAGCYVSAQKEKIVSFARSFGLLEEEEIYKYLDLFRKGLSGTLGKNLINMEFPDEQETEGGREEFLYRLNLSRLEDEDLLEEFYDKVIEGYLTSESYLILLIANDYDVPKVGSDQIEQFDASEQVYSYLQALICPVDLAKPALSYDKEQQSFRSRIRDWVVGMPAAGFLFPAFNERMSDIHAVLYYSKNAEDLHFDLTERVLGCQLPLPAPLQKEAFTALVEETLGENCDFETVKAIHDTLRDKREEAKDDPEPVTLDQHDVRIILSEAGMKEDAIPAFEAAYEENVGQDSLLHASNLPGTRKFEVHTPDVTITVSPDRTDLIEEKMIDGRRCLVIPITDEVTVNGIRLH